MEMLATSRSISAAQSAAGIGPTEAEIDRLSQQAFLENLPLSQMNYSVSFVVLALCGFYLPDWKLLAVVLALNAAAMIGMYYASRRILREDSPVRRASLWRVYNGLSGVSGLVWAATMLPVVGTLGRDIASMFVCVVIIVSVSVTAMVVASQRTTFLCFLFGFVAGLIPQAIIFLDTLGPIPLVATIGLALALIGLTNAIRKQIRLMIRTQLENQSLTENLSHALATAEYLASRDSLTGLYNRRAFEELAGQVRSDAGAQPLSLILVDLDHFKSINDTYGHAMGDLVLTHTAELITRHIGPLDVIGRGDGAIARWGGEEFILLLRDCSVERAMIVAETLREALKTSRGALWSENLVVTGSLGVAEWPSEISLHSAISRADEAMYAAKYAGRDQVRAYAGTDHALPDNSLEANTA